MTVASPPPPPPQNPYAPQPPVGPKTTSPWLWVGLGCLVLLLLFAGFCAYGFFKVKQFAENPEKLIELALKNNPDVELIRSDKAAKTFTVRDKRTGKEMTFNFDDIKNGNFSMEGPDGEKVNIGGGQVQVTDEKGQTTTIAGGTGTSNLPDWLPIYPGSSTQSSFSSSNESVAMLTTTDSSDQALAFYEEKLKDAGFDVKKNAYQVNNQTAGGTVEAKSSDKGDVTVAVVGQGGTTTITVSHKQK